MFTQFKRIDVCIGNAFLKRLVNIWLKHMVNSFVCVKIRLSYLQIIHVAFINHTVYHFTVCVFFFILGNQ